LEVVGLEHARWTLIDQGEPSGRTDTSFDLVDGSARVPSKAEIDKSIKRS
jgi:hypothetical protein